MTKILYPEVKEHDLSYQQRRFADQIESYLMLDKKYADLSEKIIENNKSTSRGADSKQKEHKRLHSALSRIRKDAIMKILVDKAIEAFDFWEMHSQELHHANQMIQDTICQPCKTKLVERA